MDDFKFAKKHVDDYFDSHLCPNCQQNKLESAYRTTINNGRTKRTYLECKCCGLVFYQEYGFIKFMFDGWVKRKEILNDSSKERVGNISVGSKDGIGQDRRSDGQSDRKTNGRGSNKLGSKGTVRRQGRKTNGSNKSDKTRRKKVNSKV